MQGNEVSFGVYHSSDVNALSFSKSAEPTTLPPMGLGDILSHLHTFLCWAFLPLQTLGIRRLKRCWDIQNFETHPHRPYWRSKHTPLAYKNPQKKIGLGTKVQFRNSTRRKSAGGDKEIWQLWFFKSACGKPGLLTQPCRIVQGPSSTMNTKGTVVVVEVVMVRVLPNAFS